MQLRLNTGLLKKQLLLRKQFHLQVRTNMQLRLNTGLLKKQLLLKPQFHFASSTHANYESPANLLLKFPAKSLSHANIISISFHFLLELLITVTPFMMKRY
jgi:hypothetical protein